MPQFTVAAIADLADWVTDELIQVGPLAMRIVSDVPDFPALRYFSRRVRRVVEPPGTLLPQGAHVEIWCVSLADTQLDSGLDLPVDCTARAKGFQSGYYATDHFGPPVRTVTKDRRILVFGPRLENLIWPYFVKNILLQYCVRNDSLFFKAAAVALGGGGTLILGRGGSGKTVLLSELCQHGARFITNSHAIVSCGAVTGVMSSMRMRPGPWVDRLGVRTTAALDPMEVVVDPADAFPMHATSPVPIRNLVIADYQGSSVHLVEKLSRAEALAVIEQFSLGLNVYRLEEDLLDGFAGDYRAFACAYTAMKDRLYELVDRCCVLHVATDVCRAANRDYLLKVLARPNR